MTSLYGTFQSFDYDTFLQQQCECKKPVEFSYPEGTMMAFLKKNHPVFSQLIIRARLDQRLADPQGKFTVFIPPSWEKVDPSVIDRYDPHEARTIVDECIIRGRIRLEDIQTSKNSQVFSADRGVPIHLWWDFRSQQLKKDQSVIVAQHTCSNGILFLLNH